MQTRQFEATPRQQADHRGAPVVDLHGNVNRDSEPALTRAYDEAMSGGAETLLLNFDDVHYINSTGIAVIVGLVARARREGRAIAVCGLTEHYRTIFEITRLIDFMRVYPDEESALAGSAPAAT
ncbi:MAG TPA: STAS domain-containing protein [Thermomicrobiales bacterium]|nr:STAS domain-containing protein [Thermomicrobiales bacterium]